MDSLDERLKKTFAREILGKSLLVDPSEVERVKKEHLLEGWELYKETPVNGRVKLTFKKAK